MTGRSVWAAVFGMILFGVDVTYGQQLLWPDTLKWSRRSWAVAVSADGRFVVGVAEDSSAVQRSFLYDVQTKKLKSLDSFGGKWVVAYDISEYGNAIVGWAEDSNSKQFAFWLHVPTQTVDDLGTFATKWQWARSWARGVSGDGKFVVGEAQDDSARIRVFRWSARTGRKQDLTPSWGFGGRALGISADGQFVVGWAWRDKKRQAVRWNAETGHLQELGSLGGDESWALKVSADGRYVVGWAKNAAGHRRAFLWDAQTGTMQDLGTLGGDESVANAISADGRYVVGWAQDSTGVIHAFRWDAQTRSMESLNAAYASILSDGSHLTAAYDITHDGRYIVGEGLRAGTWQSRAFWLNTCSGGDTDQDYICDDWERNGIDINNDGTVDLNLPALGAKVGQRDIFVEYDAMQGMAPSKAAIDSVVAAFRRAPGNPPFVLHVQNGGDLSIPPDSVLTVWQEFDALKTQYFGTPAERSSPNWKNIRKAKRQVFRYCLFAIQFAEGKDSTFIISSGYAELPGDDFIVSLGHSSWQDFRQQLLNKPNPPLTWDNVVAGTFMHELGHTLGLRHGGSDHTNHKPNFHSVMNYLWQWPRRSYAGSWILDYSRQTFTTLNEDSLSEPAGIGGHAGHVLPIDTFFVHERGPVDWNRDGDTGDTGVARDVNRDKRRETLRSYNDWANINLRRGINWQDRMHIPPSRIQRELTPPAIPQKVAGADGNRLWQQDDALREMTFEIYQQLASLNDPPSEVEIIEPLEGAAVPPTPTFVFKANDPQGDSLVYRIELRRDTTAIVWQTAFAAPDIAASFTLPDSLALAGGTWEFRVRAMDWKTALGYWSQWRTITVEATSVSENPLFPRRPILEQNQPEPFHSTTTIPFFLPQRTAVTLKVFDLFGREIATVIDAVLEAGRHSVVFDASKLPDGVYIYQLRAGEIVEVKRMVLVR